MMKTLLNDAIDKGKGVNTVLKKVMGRLIGERMLTQQETCNLILALPMVKCSYNFVNLHLESNNNKVDLKLLGNSNTTPASSSKPATIHSLMFLYGKRYNEQFWDKPELFLKHKSACLAMPLNKFVVHFSVGTRGASRNKIRERTRQNTVVIFYPHVRGEPNAFTYPHYCKLALLKFKP
jgi:hypothetical protein